jgi:hypothetical protein
MFRSSILILITLTGVMFGVKNLYATPKFIPGINGLMTGLVLIPEKQVVFDTLNGRIIEVFATGKNSPDDILSFYGATLPQLGWISKSPNEFRRDKELLKVEITDNLMGRVEVRISIAPRPD